MRKEKCSKCNKDIVLNKRGYHQVLIPEGVGYYHWDCLPAYSAKIDDMLKDAHSKP